MCHAQHPFVVVLVIAIELTIEQFGRNLLLTDSDKDISTTLKGVAFDDLLAHQPELFG